MVLPEPGLLGALLLSRGGGRAGHSRQMLVRGGDAEVSSWQRMDLYRFWKRCPLLRFRRLKVTAFPVSNRFMTIDIGASPVRSSRWKWFGMSGQA